MFETVFETEKDMAKEKILEVTEQLIKEKGLTVSVRDIANTADVNVSAVSYHFGNKDNLIKEVIAKSMLNFKDVFNKLDNQQIEPLVRLEIFLEDTIELINQNQELSDYVLNQSDLFQTRYEYMQYLESVGYSKLVSLIQEITSLDDQNQILIIIEQMLAANVVSYITEMKIASKNPQFELNQDYKQRIRIFIENYFYRYSVEGK